jgi:hypothetical protein
MSLSSIGQYITIYVGFFIVIIGVVGNGINIFIFSSVHNYRTTPCTFYFLIASIYNIGYITINLISRIVIAGYEIDLTRTSISWCKIRQFFIHTLVLLTLSCSCLATIDQFFVTSRSANHRRFSNIKWAHRIVIIVSIFWCLYGIPYLVLYNISPVTTTCVTVNTLFANYVPVNLILLLFVVPIVVMVSFGYLTYRNIHLTRGLANQHADRQLIRMTLIQVVLVVICYGPYGISTAYSVITLGISQDANQAMIESFVGTIIILLSYIYYSVGLFFCEIIKQMFL